MNKDKYKDLKIGNKYNKLTVISILKSKRGAGQRCECQCDCGNIITLNQSQLIDNRNKSCGCLYEKDILNKKFGKLLVISKYREKNRSFVNCICDCGDSTTVEQYKLLTGHTKSCGCIRRDSPSPNRKAYGEASKNFVIGAYKKGAKNRNLEFSLDDETIIKLLISNCFYCGSSPSRIVTNETCYGEFVCGGIDRVDNNIGYIKENCVPCCKICNIMKMDATKENFLHHIDKIYNFQFNRIVIGDIVSEDN